MNKKTFLLILFGVSIFIVFFSVRYLKEIKINQFKQSNYQYLIEKSEIELQTLIKEKQNTTAMIAMGLSKNTTLLNSLKEPTKQFINLAEYSLELREKTTFKNVWFQLISKDGYTLQRSWTDYKGDRVADVRKDLQQLIKNPQMQNTISVGKFDMTFKSITPIYDEGKNFMGLIEVITHFNSIAKKLEQNNIKPIILADKSYKKQLTKPFSKKFIDDYYVAIKDVDPSLMRYFQSVKIDNYLKNFSKQNYFVDTELNTLVSYYTINNIKNETMGHFLLFHPLNSIDTSKITEITYFYNIIGMLGVIVLVLLFYFTYSNKEQQINQKNFNTKLLLLTLIAFALLSLAIYSIIKEKYDHDIEQYKQNIIAQTLLEYNSILNNNKAIADLIFTREINTAYIKQLLKSRKRDTLYNHLKKSYKELQNRYNIRQIHFHLPDSTSFLRMHRPNKFGDSLKGVRESVDFVNSEKIPFIGFEEGRIYNGFRHVYPLSLDNKHIGSVEASFDIYTFIDNYINSFKVERVNFLVNKDIIDEKVFQSEQNNYIKSPVKGYCFDKVVVEKLKDLNKPIIPQNKKQSDLDYISKNIHKGQPFSVHFKEINELAVVIPLINELNQKVIGSINISKDASFIQQRNNEFNQLIATIIVVLAFIMVFIYREVLTRNRLNNELKKNQIILDSQSSFIIITNGMHIKASNRSMLEFFGYDSLKSFKKEHDCICDFFEAGSEFIKKQMGELNWFEYLQKNPNGNHLVQIKDKNNNPYIFFIQVNFKNRLNQDDYIVTFIDITNIKNMEQHLIHSEKMASLGNMIGNIAHQWRQPLSVISTAASGIEVQKEFGQLSDEELHKFIKTILANTEFLSETIDTFRNFLKEDKTVSNQIIQNVLDDTLTILSPTLKNNHIELINKIQYQPQISKNMSKGELTQVITNLINNAKDILLQNRVENPQVILSCFVKNGTIFITTEDNAGGVPEDIIDQIFEPYFTTKHQSMGTGLGLYMSHKIITESLKGQLFVTNTEQGAKFVIKLPLDTI